MVKIILFLLIPFTLISSTSISLNWNEIDEADGYRIYFRYENESYSTYFNLGDTLNFSFTINDSLKRFCAITWYNDEKESDFSNEVCCNCSELNPIEYPEIKIKQNNNILNIQLKESLLFDVSLFDSSGIYYIDNQTIQGPNQIEKEIDINNIYYFNATTVRNDTSIIIGETIYPMKKLTYKINWF